MNPEPAFALRNFVRVVHRREVDAACMDIEALPQVAHAHCGALEMPAREAPTPGRVPFLKPLHTLLGEFPDREI